MSYEGHIFWTEWPEAFQIILSLSYINNQKDATVCRQPQTYVKPEAAITVFELLMMSGVSLETC
jgi:hypothetical protein